MYNTIAQIFGIMGAVFLMLSFQMKKSNQFFISQALGSGLFLINYVMLGAYTGVLISIMSVTRTILIPICKRKQALIIFPLLLIIPVIITFFIYTGIESVCMIVAYVAFTLSMITKSSKIIRLTQFFCASPLQLTHNLMVNSIGGVICEIFNILSVIVSAIRLGLNEFEK